MIRDTLASKTVSENPTSLRYLFAERGRGGWEDGKGERVMRGSGTRDQVTVVWSLTATIDVQYHKLEKSCIVHACIGTCRVYHACTGGRITHALEAVSHMCWRLYHRGIHDMRWRPYHTYAGRCIIEVYMYITHALEALECMDLSGHSLSQYSPTFFFLVHNGSHVHNCT